MTGKRRRLSVQDCSRRPEKDMYGTPQLKAAHSENQKPLVPWQEDLVRGCYQDILLQSMSLTGDGGDELTYKIVSLAMFSESYGGRVVPRRL